MTSKKIFKCPALPIALFQGCTNYVTRQYWASAQISPRKATGPNERKPRRVGASGARLPGRLGTGLAGQRPLSKGAGIGSLQPSRQPRSPGSTKVKTSAEFPTGKLKSVEKKKQSDGPAGATGVAGEGLRLEEKRLRLGELPKGPQTAGEVELSALHLRAAQLTRHRVPS